MGKAEEDEIPWFSAMTTYFSYSILILFGQMRDFFGSLTGASRYNKAPEPVSPNASFGVASTLLLSHDLGLLNKFGIFRFVDFDGRFCGVSPPMNL